MKNKLALLIIILISTMFGNGCASFYVYTVGQAGNYESRSTDYRKKPPVGFRTTLKNLESNFYEEWTAFDKNAEACTVYYGWLRGNVRGQFKLKLCEDRDNGLVHIELIALNRHGIGGMGISGYKDAGKTDKPPSEGDLIRLPLDIKNLVVGPKIVFFQSKKDKTAFISRDSIKVPLSGGDIWGPFIVKVEGKFINQENMVVGKWNTNHGFFGNYKGTLYGVRLNPGEKASASISNENLYQSMLSFDPEKK